MNTQKGRTGHKGATQQNLQDRLIPFPVRNGFTGLYPDSKSDALWPILARNQRNPFVKFLRTVFYYSDYADDQAQGADVARAEAEAHGGALLGARPRARRLPSAAGRCGRCPRRTPVRPGHGRARPGTRRSVPRHLGCRRRRSASTRPRRNSSWGRSPPCRVPSAASACLTGDLRRGLFVREAGLAGAIT